MKLTIDNFQSIGHAELEFPVGITTITGPNSSGKSAVLRSLEFFTKNRGKKSHIKRGFKNFGVCIQLGDDIFSWKRGSTSGTFSKNGETVEKIGTKTPHEYFPDFPLQLDDKDGVLQMSGEWDKLFPFDRTESELFILFEKVFNISDSSAVLDEIRGSVKTLVQNNELLVSKYNSLVDNINSLESLCIQSKINTVDSMLSDLRAKLSEVPLESDLTSALSLQEKMSVNIPHFSDFDVSSLDISDVEKDASLAASILYCYDGITKVVKHKKEIPTHVLDEVEEIEIDLSKSKLLQEKIVLIDSIEKKVFEDVEYPYDMESLVNSTVQSLLQDYDKSAKDLDNLREKESNILSQLSEVKTCPLCGSKL